MVEIRPLPKAFEEAIEGQILDAEYFLQKADFNFDNPFVFYMVKY